LPPLPQLAVLWLASGSHVVALLQQPAQPVVVSQTQWPPEHVAPLEHAMPQPPQFEGSVDVSVQALPQSI
jgi:hypothetical protein